MGGRRNQSQMLRKYVDFRITHKPVAGFFNRVFGSVRFGKITLMFPKISKTFVLFTFGLLFVA